MRRNEQKLWDRMRHGLKNKVYFERVENVMVPGRPDVDTMWNGITIPIELKAVEDYPHRPSTAVLGRKGLNQNQLNWWLNWKRLHGSGFIVVGVARDIFTVPAEHSDQINSFTREDFRPFESSWQQLIQEIRKEVLCLQNP